MPANFYAHSLAGQPPEKWEPLEDHLRAVAALARDFAAKFGAADWGELVGLWHDVGKFSREFQAYLHRENGIEAHLELEDYAGRVDHSTAGAQLAVKGAGAAGRILAYCIAGHHAGLPDAVADAGKSGLDHRLAATVPAIPDAPLAVTRARELSAPRLSLKHGDERRAAFQVAFFCRMLFSALVDADFLATERFMAPERHVLRRSEAVSLSALSELLDVHIEGLAASRKPNEVHRRRSQVLAECRAAVTNTPGLFSLTVPTGGGKTLASLSFALRHAAHHEMERVIYAIPFTSIIEQTADVFRPVFETLHPESVLEHHSNLDPERETAESRISAENWDAPIVVTTNVQFFESLFASKTSRCRKLHRIARSVIILDEAQTLPVELLAPCLAAIRELVTDYRCSIVLCTATQPAIARRDDFAIGLDGIREMIARPDELYTAMKRVGVRNLGRLTDQQLIGFLAPRTQHLCILNTRPHASRIFDQLVLALPGADHESVFHLSTRMCAEHRSAVLREIRRRLVENLPCRVVSTQLIEAGVDVDFPVVFRSLAGIDSIAQAAGRCNREGRFSGAEVFVFEPIDCRLQGYLHATAASAAELLPDFDDLLSPECVRRYFELHYWKHDDLWDHHRILDLFQKPARQLFQFRTAAALFQMIQDASRSVIVPWEDGGRELLRALQAPGTLDWRIKRRLQRYTVPVLGPDFDRLGAHVELLRDCYPVLVDGSLYDERTGLRMDRAGFREPESLII